MWSVIGNSRALASLDVDLRSDRPAHAYLFSGPPDIGKRTVALEFAAGLNCRARDRPCGLCRSCRDTLSAGHPDVEMVAPGGLCDEPEHKDHPDSVDLRICQIRRLERVLALSPYAAPRRVAIVDAADTLRTEAANAFLKTLEEPPAGSVIILLAESPERLPETVLSRCRSVGFRPLRRAEIEEALEARGVEKGTAARIAIAAAGRLGWALRAAAAATVLEERSASFVTARHLAHASRAERFRWAKGAENRSPETRQRFLAELEIWASWWRDVLIVAAGNGHGALTNEDLQAEVRQEGKLYVPSDLVAFLRALQETREMLHLNVDPRLALENLMLDMPVERDRVV